MLCSVSLWLQLPLLFVVISCMHLLCTCNAEMLRIVKRSEWNAQTATEFVPLAKDLQYAVIHHSAGAYCNTPAECRQQMRNMQHYHMNTRHYPDIGYNFGIGGDGDVYEGRGADYQGAHSFRWNSRSIGIVFIGNYNDHVPTAVQIQRCRDLLNELVDSGHLRSDYIIYGHQQLRPTECPGKYLYNEIKTWPQWRLMTPS